jgi:regulatory protein YycI of two-component signal transduction system YycFG
LLANSDLNIRLLILNIFLRFYFTFFQVMRSSINEVKETEGGPEALAGGEYSEDEILPREIAALAAPCL